MHSQNSRSKRSRKLPKRFQKVDDAVGPAVKTKARPRSRSKGERKRISPHVSTSSRTPSPRSAAGFGKGGDHKAPAAHVRGGRSKSSKGANSRQGSTKQPPDQRKKMPAPKLVRATQNSVELKIPEKAARDRGLTEVWIQRHVLVSNNSGPPDWETVATLPIDQARHVVVSGLRSNTTYYFRFKGFANNAWGRWSTKSGAMLTAAKPRKRNGKSVASHSEDEFQVPAKKVRVGSTRPGQPKPPICVSRNLHSIVVSWTDPKDTGRQEISCYQLQNRRFDQVGKPSGANSGGPEEEAAKWKDVFGRGGFEGKTYEVTSLPTATVYQFRVKVKNCVGWGKYSRPSNPFSTLSASDGSESSEQYSNAALVSPGDVKYDNPKVRLGKGSYGVVYRSAIGGYRGTTVAVKVELQGVAEAEAESDGSDDLLKDWIREVSILSNLRHPNLLLYMGACRANQRRYIITEYMKGGSLQSALYVSSEPLKDTTKLKSILLQVASAMAYLHSNTPEITHRDLKPANVLLDKMWTHAKVCDFGLARMHPQEIMSTLTKFAGTSPYMPPEALEEKDVTGKVDVYSFAVMVCEIFQREQPWSGMSTPAIVRAVVMQNKRPYKLNSSIPLHRLIESCWALNPVERPSFEEILVKLAELGWSNND